MSKLARLGLFLLIVGAPPRIASADQLQGVAIGGAARSSWQGEGILMAGGRLGLRTGRRFAVHGLGSFGYAGAPDPGLLPVEPGPRHRVLAAVGAGVQMWGTLGVMQPWVRVGVVLQQERSLRSFADDPIGPLLEGRPDVVRRAGVLYGAGADLPLWTAGGVEIFLTAELSTTRFAERGGPSRYRAVCLGFGANFERSRTSPGPSGR